MSSFDFYEKIDDKIYEFLIELRQIILEEYIQAKYELEEIEKQKREKKQEKEEQEIDEELDEEIEEEIEILYNEQDKIRENDYIRKVYGHQKDTERRQRKKKILYFGQKQYSYIVEPKNIRTRQEKKRNIIEQQRMIYQ